MRFGQEHVEEAELLGSGLEVVDDRRIGGPALVAFAELGVEDFVGGDAFLVDELLDLMLGC